MDDLRCIGCGREFDRERSLISHEAQCEASKQVHDEILTKHRHLEKERRQHHAKRQRVASSPHPPLPSLPRLLADAPTASGPHVHNVHHSNDDLVVDDPMDVDLEVQPENIASSSRITLDNLQPIVSARSGRRIRLPARYADYLPGESDNGLRNALPPRNPAIISTKPPSPSRSEPTPAPPHYQTEADQFGLFRVYPTKPSVIPDAKRSVSAVVDAPTLSQSSLPSSGAHNLTTETPITPENLYSAFSSPTAGLLMTWQYTGSTSKSIAELERLASYTADPLYNHADAASFSHDRERRRIEKVLLDESNPFHAEHGWRKSPVMIPLIKEGVKYQSENDPTIPMLTVDVIHRSIIEIIKSTFADSVSTTFHMSPYEQFWKPSDDSEQVFQVYSEAYSSPRMLRLQKEVNSLPRKAGDDYERVIAPLMLWSDATQLANFGNASLWPVYLSFGNQSKYTRGKPTSNAMHHAAYIPKLPDNFQDIYIQHYGEASTDEIYTHCKRELMHAIWKLLLDDEFVKAYRDGMLIRCSDGIIRRIFPRMFSYSADYPEKVLLACIKFLGDCPCPRCLVSKNDIPEMWSESDMHTRLTNTRKPARTKVEKARKQLFKEGRRVGSSRVAKYLKSESLVPTYNSFSERICDELFNYFLLFVVDLLHEFELGVWKAIFIHLMRILYAAGGVGVQELNWRYRKVPTFGRGTIRKFHKNASAMKRLAAWDFEDLLQCSIPVFEALLPPPHDQIILDLLFDLATWHAFSKLRLHTDATLDLFDIATRSLSHSVRRFEEKTCSFYHTTELPQEYAARGRREAALAAKQPSRGGRSTGPKVKRLNLKTYKYHALGDYPSTIREYGTTDSYSTQMGELEHRRVKRRYTRSGKKNGSMVESIANQEAIQRFIQKVDETRESLQKKGEYQTTAPSRANRTRRQQTSPCDHYHISINSRSSRDLTEWLSEKGEDPAIQDFFPRLKDHLLARLRGLAYNGDEYEFSDDDRATVLFHNNMVHEHSLLRINYTTYDLRREQDTINPATRPDIMLLSQEDERTHPYWYARVVKILHLMVEHRPDPNSPFSRPSRMDVLFVRWFQRDSNFNAGWDAKRLHRLQFFDADHLSEAFGFVDPNAVVRGVHLIPGYGYGRVKDSEDYLGDSVAREDLILDEWQFYYVNIFVDRDMFMRFRGGGVGHLATRDWDEFLQREGRVVREDDDEDTSGDESEPGDDEEESDGSEEEEEVEMEGIEYEGELEGDVEDLADNDSDEDDPDRVVADEGEELDDDIWAEEGYGAL